MSFEEDLDYSYKQSKRPFWAEAYKRYFGDRDLKTDLITPVEDRPDSGADKLVTLSNGHSYLIDEKVHRRKGFQDDMIFVEHNHRKPNGSIKPGWVKDNTKKVDYLAYAKEDNQVVYIFPFPALQRTWEHYETDLLTNYEKTETKNYYPDGGVSYVSECVLISAQELFDFLEEHFTVYVPDSYWKQLGVTT